MISPVNEAPAVERQPEVKKDPEHTNTLGAYALTSLRSYEDSSGMALRMSAVLKGWLGPLYASSTIRDSLDDFGNQGFTYLSKGIPVNETDQERMGIITKRNGDDEVIDISEEEYDLLIDSAPTEGLRLLASISRDIAHPPGEEALNAYGVRLGLRPKGSTSVKNHGGRKDEARLCGRAEGMFADEVNVEGRSRLVPIEIDGKIIGYQKLLGEETVITTQPTVLNGVRLPRGTILTTEVSDDGERSFSYGRLSLFAHSDILSSGLDSPKVSNTLTSSRHNIQKMLNLVQAEDAYHLPSSREEVGRRLTSIREALDNDLELRKCFNILNREVRDLASRSKEFEKRMDAELEVIWKRIEEIRRNPDIPNYVWARAQREKDRIIYRMYRSSLNPSVSYQNSYRNLIRIFGADKVRESLRIIAQKEALERLYD